MYNLPMLPPLRRMWKRGHICFHSYNFAGVLIISASNHSAETAKQGILLPLSVLP